MRKRILSILLMCCMVLCLVPNTAFAEGETEESPVCTCETACAAEAMNADCPICGAEGALPENCAKCAQPADDAAVQPEGKVSAPQPETALTALIGGSETVTEVSTADELTAAIADSNVSTVRLAGDISISSSLTVKRTVTLDLNGHVLKYGSANNGSVIVVEGSGNLTLTDSNTTAKHKFMPNGKLWVLDDASGTEAATGGVITGGTGTDISTFGGTTWYCGGGALIKNGGSLTMRGGNIIGCSAECGGVYVLIRNRVSSLCPAAASPDASPPTSAAVFLLPARSKCQVRRSFAAAPPKESPILPTAEAYLSTAAVAL